MLRVGAGLRVFVGIEPVSMRGSFDSLAGAARRLQLEPSDGHLYVFLNRRRRQCRILWFDGSAWCLFGKRLERGTFELPHVPEGACQVTIDPATLASLLEGIELTAGRRRWYRKLEK